MSSNNVSVQVPDSASSQATPQRNERPYLGEKEPKFVIKLACPIPS
jgi:hypothetical protein